MNLTEYMQIRGHGITYIEAKTMGIVLNKGWKKRYANRIVPVYLVKLLESGVDIDKHFIHQRKRLTIEQRINLAPARYKTSNRVLPGRS